MAGIAYRALAGAEALFLRLSLHRRIAVFVSSILLAVFLAFGYVGWEALTRSTAATLQERHSTALIFSRHLDDLIGHAHGHLVATSRELVAESGGLERERTQQVLDRTLNQVRFFYSRLLVFDAQGRLIAGSPAADEVRADEEVREVLDQALHTGQPAISNLLDLPAEGAPGVLFVAPIVLDGRVAGVVAGEMPIPHPSISTPASALELGRTGHMEVVDGRGQILASTDSDEVIHRSEHHSFYSPLLAMRINTVGRALYEEDEAPEPEWHVMAFVPLAHAPWGVGLGQDETETFATTLDLRDRAFAVAAVALAVALLCAWLGTQSVVHPIQALTRAGERMATGDLSEPIRVAHSDEVGRLAQVLEAMRQRLGQSLAEITAWNRELEQRVHERTRELETSNRHLQALMAVATVASQGMDREAVLSKALEELVETLGVQRTWAFLWDDGQRLLRLVKGWGLDEPLREAELIVADPEALCVIALRSPTILCQPITACPSLPADLSALAAGMSCWCAPIRIGDQSLGTLCLALPSDRVLEGDEVALVHGIAHQVAVAFENSRLTEERTRLEASQRLELLRAEFLASVSHELRTPLGFIKGYTTTMLRDDVAWDPGQQQEFLHIIDEESDRLNELVESLLDTARVQAGRLRLHPQQVQIEQIVRRSVDRMAGALGNHQVELHLERAPTIIADGARLEQVVVNLLQNAAKYSLTGGPIEVHLSVEQQEVRLSVLDRGVGVPPTELGKIFEPFYRVQAGSAANVGGAGLGLAICRAIVEAHGGRIWAEARPEGGTAVHLTVPRHAGEDERGRDGTEARARS